MTSPPLPFKLARELPEGIDAQSVEFHVPLPGGLGVAWGETHLIFARDRLIALTQESVLDPPRLVELDPEVAPKLRSEKWQDMLIVAGADGEPYEIALSSAGKDEALTRLEGLYRRLAAWDELLRSYLHRIEASYDAAEKLQLRLALADLYEHQLADLEAACDCYLEVLAEQSDRRDARDGLERIYRAGIGRDRIAAVLEPIYRDSGSWERLVELLRYRISRQPDADRKRDLWLEVAELLEHFLGRPSEALEALGQAAALAPDEEGLLGRIDALVESHDDWEGGVSVYAQLLKAAIDGDGQVALLRRLARALETKLADLPRAERAYDAILQLRGDRDMQALAGLGRLYVAQERWADAIKVHQRELAAVEALGRRVELLNAIAELQAKRLGQADEAIRSYQAVLRLSPLNLTALRGLERLYQASESWRALYELLERLFDLMAVRDARVEILKRRARLAERRLDDREAAIALWFRVRAADPDDPEVVDELQRLLTLAERWSDLAGILEERRQHALDRQERAELARHLAKLYGGPLADPQRALACWQEILDDAPRDVEALLAVKPLYAAQGDDESVAIALERLLEVVPADDPERPEYRVELARTLDQGMGVVPDAIAAWGEVLAGEPRHQEALDSLARLYRASERYDEALAVLERRLALEEQPTVLARLWQHVAEVQGLRGAGDMAAKAWKQVLEYRPEHAEAFARLEKYYLAVAAWEALGLLYRGRLSVIVDAKSRFDLLMKAARVAEDRQQLPSLAFQLLVEGLTDYWREGPLVMRLTRLALATGAWEELFRRFEEVREQVDEVQEQATFQTQLDAAVSALDVAATRKDPDGTLLAFLGRYYEAGESTKMRAARCYDTALKRNPRLREAWLGKARVLSAAGRWRDVARHLRSMAGQRRLFTREARRDCLQRLAEVYRTRLSDEAEAAWATKQARRARRSGGVRALLLLVALAAAAAGAYWLWLELG